MAKNGIGKLLAGVGIGVGLGMLFAPEKGEETRKKLKEKFSDLINEAKNIDIDDVKMQFEDKVNSIKEDLENLDKETVKEIAQEKIEVVKNKLEDLGEMAKYKATPVVEEKVNDLRKYALKTIKGVEKKLSKPVELDK